MTVHTVEGLGDVDIPDDPAGRAKLLAALKAHRAAGTEDKIARQNKAANFYKDLGKSNEELQKSGDEKEDKTGGVERFTRFGTSLAKPVVDSITNIPSAIMGLAHAVANPGETSDNIFKTLSTSFKHSAKGEYLDALKDLPVAGTFVKSGIKLSNPHLTAQETRDELGNLLGEGAATTGIPQARALSTLGKAFKLSGLGLTKSALADVPDIDKATSAKLLLKNRITAPTTEGLVDKIEKALVKPAETERASSEVRLGKLPSTERVSIAKPIQKLAEERNKLITSEGATLDPEETGALEKRMGAITSALPPASIARQLKYAPGTIAPDDLVTLLRGAARSGKFGSESPAVSAKASRLAYGGLKESALAHPNPEISGYPGLAESVRDAIGLKEGLEAPGGPSAMLRPFGPLGGHASIFTRIPLSLKVPKIYAGQLSDLLGSGLDSRLNDPRLLAGLNPFGSQDQDQQ